MKKISKSSNKVEANWYEHESGCVSHLVVAPEEPVVFAQKEIPSYLATCNVLLGFMWEKRIGYSKNKCRHCLRSKEELRRSLAKNNKRLVIL